VPSGLVGGASLIVAVGGATTPPSVTVDGHEVEADLREELVKAGIDEGVAGRKDPDENGVRARCCVGVIGRDGKTVDARPKSTPSGVPNSC